MQRGKQFSSRQSLMETKNVFEGFFHLFWTSLLLHVFVSLFKSGHLGSGTFKLMYIHFTSFAIVDGLMISSLFSAVLLEKYWKPSLFTLYISNASLFIFWLSVCWEQNWSWVQSGTFSMHLIAMIFKIHSYGFCNIQFRHSKPKGYPENLTFGNFFNYLLFPTLCYELNYPRSNSFRPMYLVKKLLMLFCNVFLMYFMIENYIIPVLKSNISFYMAIVELLFPFMVCYLIIFHIIFECVLNGFAEISKFDDRHFYDDWWNSSSFDQFARRWNIPVHEFLMRHVYLESISTYKTSKQTATYITFLFSSILHELVMFMTTRKLKLYLFFLQMFQLPLIYLGRLPWSKNNPTLGNIFFWVSMYCGPPLLAAAYCWEFYQ